MHIQQLKPNSLSFPNPLEADDRGLLAFGGDLSSKRLLKAYQMGIFPWFNEEDPILWWSPNPRFVLDLDEVHISKSLKKTIKKEIFEIRFDTNFVQVMIKCASAKRPDQDNTWIVSDMIEAYSELFSLGVAHSFEAFYEGKLVGGGYGVIVGNIFCGESMFAKKTDASKVAFVALVKKLKKQGFKLIDSQIHTKHLETFGAKRISRKEYLTKLSNALKNSKKF